MIEPTKFKLLRNKIKATMILGVLIMLTCSKCMAMRSVKLKQKKQHALEVYSMKIPSKEYIEIKYMEVEGSLFSSPENLMKKLSTEAQKEGADALINVQIAHVVCRPLIWGIAVKYKQALN